MSCYWEAHLDPEGDTLSSCLNLEKGDCVLFLLGEPQPGEDSEVVGDVAEALPGEDGDVGVDGSDRGLIGGDW